jgi:RES domain-containing protein
MILWRISNHGTLDGRGGLLASARWHTQGREIVYLAESPAGAFAEALVNLELDSNDLPSSYKLLKSEAPDGISTVSVRQTDIAATWIEDFVLTRTIGDEWLASNKSALLRVPSAIIPETYNFLLNPNHPEAAGVKVLSYLEYPWDHRLLQR